MAKIGFLGLGNIGKGICRNLIAKGHELAVYDVSADAMKRFDGSAYLAGDALDVLGRSDILFFSLPNSGVVEAIVGSFLEAGMAGKTIVDTSTSYPLSTRQLYAKVKAAGGTMVDAPLMAGPDEAEAGILDIVVGGDREDYDRLSEIFACYCRSYQYVGEIGNGHLAKLAINCCGLSEALIFAQVFPVMAKLGFSEEQLFNILNCEALSNWVFHFYAKKYVSKEYKLDFALALGTKDLAYMKRLCEELNVPGFMLDGALDLCRTSLKGQKPGEVLDFSYPCQTMYEFVKLDK
jgi:3-hydroxyisobutyrate dehydrogenase-like beta-hydroxyacid dehydrogenase